MDTFGIIRSTCPECLRQFKESPVLGAIQSTPAGLLLFDAQDDFQCIVRFNDPAPCWLPNFNIVDYVNGEYLNIEPRRCHLVACCPPAALLPRPGVRYTHEQRCLIAGRYVARQSTC